MPRPLRLVLLLALFTLGVRAAELVAPPPTHADVRYGPHERNRLDLWLPAAKSPAPLVVYIHGGGSTEGDKASAREQKLIQQCLDAGVAFAAVNYRYLAPDVPIQAILRDCARELGVEVVADLPAYGISPPARGPANLRDFFFTHPGVRASTTP